ncbi:MAG: oligosaccharide flippase family protein [Methanocella sp.]
MNVHVPAYWKAIKYQLNDPLYKNSIFMFVAKALLAAGGFIFWMLAARLYSVEEVGVAVALISSVSVINMLSLLGFENSVIRFFSLHDTNKIINTSMMIVAVSSFAIGVAYCISMVFIPSNLSLIGNPAYLLVYIAFVVVSSVIMITGNAFIAMRKTGYYLVQNAITASRIVLLVPLMFIGSFGIITATLISALLGLVFATYILSKFVKIDFRVDREFIDRSFRFSSGNYFSTLFYEVPYYLLPLLVLHMLGEADAAKYYIAFSIGSLLLQLNNTVGTSLFVEGSNGEGMRKNVIKSAVAIYAVMVPAFVAIFFFGSSLLGLYGGRYAEALDLLKLVGISAFFQVIYILFITVKRVSMGIRSIVLLNLLQFVLAMALSYALIPIFGVNGVGYALIGTFVVLDLIVLGIVKKEGWI